MSYLLGIKSVQSFLNCPSYVKCHIHVDKSKSGSHASSETGQKKEDSKHKRRSKNGKTTEPDFGGEKMQFSGIRAVEELSFVRYVLSVFTDCLCFSAFSAHLR